MSVPGSKHDSIFDNNQGHTLTAYDYVNDVTRVLACDSAGNLGVDVEVETTPPAPSPTAAGWIPFSATANLNLTGFQVKATPGKIGYLKVYNPDATHSLYVNMYNAATKTGTPTSQEIPPACVMADYFGTEGIQFTTGIFLTFSSDAGASVAPATTLNMVSGGYV